IARGKLNGSGQNPLYDLSLHQLARLIEVVVHDRVRVDANRMVNCRQQITGVDWVVERSRSGIVGPSVYVPAAHAGAGDDRGVAIRPVVATIGAVGIARSGHAAQRTAAELSDADHQGLAEQATVVHVAD